VRKSLWKKLWRKNADEWRLPALTYLSSPPQELVGAAAAPSVELTGAGASPSMEVVVAAREQLVEDASSACRSEAAHGNPAELAVLVESTSSGTPDPQSSPRWLGASRRGPIGRLDLEDQIAKKKRRRGDKVNRQQLPWSHPRVPRTHVSRDRLERCARLI
jgi:hypothetical protein